MSSKETKNQDSAQTPEKRSKPDQIFIVLIAIFFLALIWMLAQVQSATVNMKLLWKQECDLAYQETGFQWAELSEFWITIMAAVTCYFMMVASDYLLYPYFYNVFEFDKNEKSRIVKSKKITEKTFSLIYHIFIIIYGYIVLSKTEYLPRMLGGSGSNGFEMIYSELPCIKTGGYEQSLRKYYLVTLGYRVFKTFLLIYQWFINEHRSDFIEMFLHHTMTLTLYAFSFMLGFVKIGSIIMYLHDLVEPLNNSSKIFAETKAHKLVTMLSVAIFWLVWGWTRIVVFPQVIYLGIYVEAHKQIFPNYNIETHADHLKYNQIYFMIYGSMILLSFLEILHIFWFSLLTRGIYHVATKGEIKDPQERVEVDQKKTK